MDLVITSVHINVHVFFCRRLDSNAIECNCDMMWLSEMLRRQRGHTQATITCQYPQRVQGRSLMNVEDSEFNCSKSKQSLIYMDAE